MLFEHLRELHDKILSWLEAVSKANGSPPGKYEQIVKIENYSCLMRVFASFRSKYPFFENQLRFITEQRGKAIEKYISDDIMGYHFGEFQVTRRISPTDLVGQPHGKHEDHAREHVRDSHESGLFFRRVREET